MTSYLPHVNLSLELSCCCPGRREERCAVAIGVSVDQLDGVIESVCLQQQQHWPKDLLPVALHVLAYARDDSGTYKVAGLKARDLPSRKEEQPREDSSLRRERRQCKAVHQRHRTCGQTNASSVLLSAARLSLVLASL